MTRWNLWIAAGAVAAMPSIASAQGRDTTTGFEIRNDAIVRNCAGCHVRDSSGKFLSRLSYMRKTPEGWETSVRRMMTLQKVNVSPEDARAIVRYLSDNQGLAPSEARAGRFESERRIVDYRYTADTRTETT